MPFRLGTINVLKHSRLAEDYRRLTKLLWVVGETCVYRKIPIATTKSIDQALKRPQIHKIHLVRKGSFHTDCNPLITLSRRCRPRASPHIQITNHASDLRPVILLVGQGKPRVYASPTWRNLDSPNLVRSSDVSFRHRVYLPRS